MDNSDFICIEAEVIISKKYIEYGLNEIKSLTGMPDSNHLAFYLLSNGFERLMKCIICFWEYKNTNKFPSVKHYGHNLSRLKKDIVKICYSMKYQKKSLACQNDVEFLDNDQLLQNTVNLLTKLGKETRYYNFDMLANTPITYADPNEVIQDIEDEVISQNDYLQQLKDDTKNPNALEPALNLELLNFFKRYARALSRLFTIGELGKEASSIGTHLYDFIMIRDSEIEHVSG